MKIKAVNFYLYNHEFKNPIVTPKVKMTHRKALIVEFLSDDDQSYYGECNAFESDWYAAETIDTVKETLSQWAESVIHKSFHVYEDWKPYLDILDNYPTARSTVVMAIYQMYHDLPKFKVAYGATISGLSTQQLEYLKQTQPTRIKLKWTGQLNDDITLLDDILRYDFELALDANESLDVSDFQKLESINDQNILYIEEPFKSLSSTLNINHTQYPAIAIDEKATDINSIISIVNQFPVKVVIVKPFRVGGLDRVQSLIRELKSIDIKVVIGGMYEYGLSRYFTALLAREGDYPGDVTPDGYYFTDDFTQGVGKLKEGMISFHPPQIDKSKLLKLN
ncbi:o-succinylbenzoate synthase [Staphylococcus haemolyticus]|uniref:o-succinylbenzoate synthase n=1 Tax=Staphylococcus haemolyticus TaxID=1283 RepID=UPI00069EFE09|nr:o-succinylbenzoate synthase [Staphylococcus haemolyticus]PTK81233.1 o-succinylbenzoate synthase [Staphylococcus haemolyticus]PTL00019.1 o-succinylbenzoate synthase [Staphylococcus haemolyticus]PTL13996.1 o-succinylbenzoate synthase [Staphylococcus haemolyticus]UVD90072.1 o-succinylbenzoate synthase [Staphylococcus haemolyticus]WAI20398.1 MAG: o-succinylbenzoate synthase [Staphylococcus haemolyticus]